MGNKWNKLDMKLQECKDNLVKWQKRKKDPMSRINSLKKKILSFHGKDGTVRSET
jgi:hypothetical protein